MENKPQALHGHKVKNMLLVLSPISQHPSVE